MSNLLNKPPETPLVFPSILAADFGDLAADCADALARGVDGLHIDVMDGHFVPNLSLGAPVLKSLKKHHPDVYMDTHLMVTHPEDFVQQFAECGANCLTFQLEAVTGRKQNHEIDVIKQIRDLGCQVGVAINPPTPAVSVEHLIEHVDLILVMSVHPGFGGQAFIPDVLDKVRWLKAQLPNHVRLEMDGGVNEKTVSACLEAGMDTIVAGSAFFGSDDRDRTLSVLRGEG